MGDDRERKSLGQARLYGGPRDGESLGLFWEVYPEIHPPRMKGQESIRYVRTGRRFQDGDVLCHEYRFDAEYVPEGKVPLDKF